LFFFLFFYLTADDVARLREIFASTLLQMVSFTITEKGYALRGISRLLCLIKRADACAFSVHRQ